MSPDPQLPLLLRGRTVRSCTFEDSQEDPQVDTVLADRGRIVAVGRYEDLSARAGSQAQRVDARDAVIMPGLVDTHPHAMHFASFKVAAVDLSDAVNHDDIIERIRARAAVTPPGEWIMCTPVGEAHYFIRRSYRDLAEGCLPDRWALDRATSNHPVIIQAWAPHTPNVVAFNSLALKRIGISEITPERVCDTWIDRDVQGRVNGRLRGSVTNYYTRDPFWLQILSKLPAPPPELWQAGGLAGMAEMNRLGITTIFESHVMNHAHLAAYRALRAADQLTCRVLAGLDVADQAFDPHFVPSDAELRELIDFIRAATDTQDDWLRIEGVTMCRTGPCFPGFLRLHEPIRGPYGTTQWGTSLLPRRVEETVVSYCAERDVRLSVLLATPPDFDDFFETVSKLGVANDVSRQEWIVQHAILVNEASARGMQRLGMQCTTSKGFHWGKGELYRERIGEHVLRDLVPMRRLLDCGVKVGGGTDWGPRNVFEQIQLAQTCAFAGSDRRNHHDTQSVTRGEAIRMFTRDAGEVLKWPGVGVIRPGSYADLILVDKDPFLADIDELPGINVLSTMVHGRTVWQKQ